MTDPLRGLSLLVAAAISDGELSPEELRLLQRKAAGLRIAPAHLDQMVAQAKQGKLRISYPRTEQERAECLEGMLDVVCADGRVEANERWFVLRIAGVLGLSGVPAVLQEKIRKRLSADAPAAPTGASRPPAPARPAGRSAKEEPVHVIRPPKKASEPPAPTADPADRQHFAASVSISAPPPAQDPSRLEAPSGQADMKLDPVPTLADPLPPITAALLRQKIQFEGREAGILFLQQSCLWERERAEKAVEEMMRAKG